MPASSPRRPLSVPRLAFEIASQIEHCDLGALSMQERPHFARILLLAARTCRSAGEARRALHFVELIRRLLPLSGADRLDTLMFETEWLHCDCLLAVGRVDEALAALDDLTQRGSDPIAMADIFRLKAFALTVKSAYPLAIEAALSACGRWRSTSPPRQHRKIWRPPTAPAGSVWRPSPMTDSSPFRKSRTGAPARRCRSCPRSSPPSSSRGTCASSM